MYEIMNLPFGPRMHRCAPYPFRGMDEFFAPAERRMPAAFSVDVLDEGGSYRLNAELPGFAKEDISVSVQDDRLTISAERKSEEQEEKPNYVKHERFYGSFRRSFDLNGIDADAIEAEYKDGVLSLVLPKLPDETPAPRSIEIR